MLWALALDAEYMLNELALFVECVRDVNALVTEYVLNVRLLAAECVLVEDVLEVVLIPKCLE